MSNALPRDLKLEDRPKKTPGLEAHSVDGEFVVYEAATDRVHYLNATAILILEFCDGHRSVADIVALVREAYSLAEAPADDVQVGLNSLIAEGLIHL